MFLRNAFYLLAAATAALATDHKGIPKAFTKGFDATGTFGMQVSYDTAGDVTDGQDLSGQDLSKVANFALGDSSGVNTNAKFIVLMLDPDVNGDAETTNPQRLHYLRTDFSPSSGTGVGIASDVPPAVKYVGPEATTDANGVPVHRYVYLLYKQPKEFVLKGVSGEREGFDVAKWREENGLEPAVAGVHFLATVGGGVKDVAETSCTTKLDEPTLPAVYVPDVPVWTPPPGYETPPIQPGEEWPVEEEVSTHFVTVTADCACTSGAVPPPADDTAPPSADVTPPPASPPVEGAPPATTHTVIVGGEAGLVYTPEFITANPGDLVVFDFLSKNHTVTQSTLDLPCVFKADGIKSGFRANPDSIPGIELFEYTVPDAEPKWFYCAQGQHCQAGMVFAINPKDKFPQFLENAKGGNGTIGGSPTGGAVVQPPLPTDAQTGNLLTGAATKFAPGMGLAAVVAGVMAVLA